MSKYIRQTKWRMIVVLGLIKRDEQNEIEVMWMGDNEILAVRNYKSGKMGFITAYGELTMPQTLEETQVVLDSMKSGFIRTDRDVIINSNKITEQNVENGYVKLDGSDETFHVAAQKWKEIVN
jgi:DNA-binding LytR/AlgR family response regulator